MKISRGRLVPSEGGLLRLGQVPHPLGRTVPARAASAGRVEMRRTGLFSRARRPRVPALERWLVLPDAWRVRLRHVRIGRKPRLKAA